MIDSYAAWSDLPRSGSHLTVMMGFPRVVGDDQEDFPGHLVDLELVDERSAAPGARQRVCGVPRGLLDSCPMAIPMLNSSRTWKPEDPVRRLRTRPATHPRPHRRHLAQRDHRPTRTRPITPRLRPLTPWNQPSSGRTYGWIANRSPAAFRVGIGPHIALVSPLGMRVSPRSVEASLMRSGDARDTSEVRPRVP
jgi:hypothetical protein